MNKPIKGSEVEAGDIVLIYGGTQQVTVNRVKRNEIFKSIELQDLSGSWSGISPDENVTLIGHFNPEPE